MYGSDSGSVSGYAVIQFVAVDRGRRLIAREVFLLAFIVHEHTARRSPSCSTATCSMWVVRGQQRADQRAHQGVGSRRRSAARTSRRCRRRPYRQPCRRCIWSGLLCSWAHAFQEICGVADGRPRAWVGGFLCRGCRPTPGWRTRSHPRRRALIASRMASGMVGFAGALGLASCRSWRVWRVQRVPRSRQAARRTPLECPQRLPTLAWYCARADPSGRSSSMVMV